MHSIKIRYINLDRRTERNQDVLKKFSMLNFKKENIKRFSAVDGKNLVEDLKKKSYIGDVIIKIIKNKNINWNTCILSCLLSHYFLLKEIIDDETIEVEDMVFIFEDDFFINDIYLNKIKFEDIINKLVVSDINISNGWDMIFFGGRFKINFTPSNQNMEKFFSWSFDNYYLRNKGNGIDWDRTTHNYLVKKKNIKKILDLILNNYLNSINPTKEIDSLYNSLSLDIKMFDYFPHIFYSPLNYSTDIQNSNQIINSKNIH